MSGLRAGQALHDRFAAIRHAELERLKKKLAGLTEADRRFVHEIATEVVDALARGPQQVLAGGAPPLAVDTLVRLFALDV